MLSGYRLMWIMVMFDLPVGAKGERKAATDFRKFLLDEGFEMAQFSVYFRYCAGKEYAEAHTRRIGQNLPKGGKIDILFFTDKQYENIISFHGQARGAARKNPEQLALF
ncbi:MAG: CRISPR-associated endonuclease Cas2 [Pseudomonadota bacterium]|jgi:CRISPR-associated protein Cas2